MLSKLILMTFVSISFATIGYAQSTSTRLPKKRSRSAVRTPATNYNPAISMKNSVVEVSGNANAAKSQYAFQPKEGRVILSVTPEIKVLSEQTNLKAQNLESTVDTRSNILMFRAQRGLANNWSWNANMGIGSQESDTEGENTSISKGITDITLGAQQLREIALGQLFYGAKVSLSPGDREESYSYKKGRSGDGNLQSGGTSLIPYAGVQVDRRDYLLGAQAQFEYAFDKSSLQAAANGQKIYITRSNKHFLTLEGFYETSMPQFIFGAKAGIAHALESDITARTTTGKLNAGTDIYEVLNAGVYARIQANKTIDVLPSLSFSKLLGTNGGSYAVEKVDGINLTVAIRAAL